MAEHRLDVKQLLSYILVRNEEGALLCFDRGQVNRVDESFRGLTCVGFGGHVMPPPVARSLFDLDDELGLYRSAARELAEELRLPADEVTLLEESPLSCLKVIGALNDDSSPNGVRHLAFVFEYTVKDASFSRKPRNRESESTRSDGSRPTLPVGRACIGLSTGLNCAVRAFAPELASSTPTFRVRRKTPLRKAKAVCVVGPMGSGKTEAANYLRDRLDLEEINSGRVVAELLGCLRYQRLHARCSKTWLKSSFRGRMVRAGLVKRSPARSGRVKDVCWLTGSVTKRRWPSSGRRSGGRGRVSCTCMPRLMSPLSSIGCEKIRTCQ